MKFTLVRSLVVFVVILATVPVLADGLFYQLPEDGAWVQFDNKLIMTQNDNKQNATGFLRMSSVGTVTEDGQKCRWIEFKMLVKSDVREKTIVVKLLVPEIYLKQGRKIVEHRLRGWIRLSADGDVLELTENNLGPLPAFLANPLTDVTNLEAVNLESKLGDLSCVGLTGHTEFVEGTAINKVAFETRRHQKAPFGVVTSQMTIEAERGGTVAQKIDMNLTISDFGRSASSELANKW